MPDGSCLSVIIYKSQMYIIDRVVIAESLASYETIAIVDTESCYNPFGCPWPYLPVCLLLWNDCPFQAACIACTSQFGIPKTSRLQMDRRKKEKVVCDDYTLRIHAMP
jgi:hypothetical protein